MKSLYQIYLICKPLFGIEFNLTETLGVLRRNIVIFMSWGVSKLMNFDSKGLLMRVNGHHHKGYVLITLNGNDTYEVHFIKFNGEIVETITEVYWDELVEKIDTKIEKIIEYNF